MGKSPLDTRTYYVYAGGVVYVYLRRFLLPRITLYLDAAQLAFVKNKGPGWLRRVVQVQMKIAEKKP